MFQPAEVRRAVFYRCPISKLFEVNNIRGIVRRRLLIIVNALQIVYDKATDIFNKYLPMMKSLAFSLLKDHQLSEDAVQEALIRLSKNTGKIDNINSKASKNYIYTVTKNEALRILKKEKNREDHEEDVQLFDEDGFNNIGGQTDIEAFADEYGFSSEVASLLEELSEVDRDIIVYKYGAGYSLKEIAELMGMDREAVYKRHQRALVKLKEILEAGNEK